MVTKIQPASENKSSASRHSKISEEQKPPASEQFAHIGTTIQQARSEPTSLNPQQVLQLQHTIGNHGVGQLMQGTAQQSTPRSTNNIGLPDRLKSGIENLSGYSMDDVKVHYNSDKPAGLGAHAYAQGSEIHLGRGQERHLPHEAWHVVQQKQGRVRPTLQMKGGVNINDGVGLEREADVMGARALHKESGYTFLAENADMAGSKKLLNRDVVGIQTGSRKTNTVQRLEIENEVILSSFDTSMVVSSETAVMTAASTIDSFDGGHAMMYIEFIDTDNVAKTYRIHLTTPGDGTTQISSQALQYEYKPTGIFSLFYKRSIKGDLRMPGKYQAYLVDRQKAFNAMGVANGIAKSKTGYQMTFTKVTNMLKSSETMNCADFVQNVFTKGANINVSGGLFSRPSEVAAKDERTKKQIYDAAKK